MKRNVIIYANKKRFYLKKKVQKKRHLYRGEMKVRVKK